MILTKREPTQTRNHTRMLYTTLGWSLGWHSLTVTSLRVSNIKFPIASIHPCVGDTNMP